MPPSPETLFSFTDDVGRTQLENGLVVVTRESHASPTVSCMLWYRVGSRHERAGQTGLSHFLEHMLFKGTERFRKGEIDLLTMKNGGSNNAFTSYDFTAYYFNFASDRWETAIDIESDRMAHTVFEPGEFEAERQVIIEELKGRLDQPWGQLLQELNATAFRRHSYRNPVIGWLADLESTTLEGLESHYRTYYHPANAVLVLVGDFRTESAVERIRNAFGNIPAGPVPAEPAVAEPAQTEERRFDVEWRSDIPRVAIAYHVPGIAHADSYPLHLLSVVLSDGKASRLYQRLVEREQAATFATAEYSESADPTLFCLRAEGRGSAGSAQIESIMLDELSRIAGAGVSDQELERAKHQIEAHFVFSMERTLDQAMLLGHMETLADLDYIDRYLDRIRSVESSQLTEVCARYLSETNRTVGRQGRKGSVQT